MATTEPFFELRHEDGFHGPMDVALDGSVLIFSVVGDDKGDKIYVKRSEDGGATWRKTESVIDVPDMTYVNMLLASQHDENVVYATFNI